MIYNIRFYYETNASDARVKTLMRYVKKMKRFGFFVELTENHDRTNVIEIFGPRIRTDMLGNTAIKL